MTSSRSVLAYFHLVIAVSILVTGSIAFALIRQRTLVYRNEQESADYHLATRLAVAAIETELVALERGIVRELSEHRRYTDTGNHRRDLDRAVLIIQHNAQTVTAIQRRFRDRRFALPTQRLISASDGLSVASADEAGSVSSVLRQLHLAQIRCIQLDRLHQIAFREHESFASSRLHWWLLVGLIAVLCVTGCLVILVLLQLAKTAISKQKHVERELRKSEEKFRAMAEKNPAIVLIARSEKIVYGNPRLTAMTGYSNSELTQMSFLDIIHPEHRELIADRHRRRLDGETLPSHYEVRIVTKHGEERWLDLSAQRIDFEAAAAVLVMCVDVSDRKLAEVRLREMEAQLVHVSRLSNMGEMVAGIAHEINQPLAAIANFALACKNTVAATDYQYDVPVEAWLQAVNEQSVRCGDIIQRLRGFVKKGDRCREPVNLHRIVHDAIALMRSEIHHSSVAIDCRLREPAPYVHGNQVQLQQVLVNLLRNACDATRECLKPEVCVRTQVRNGGVRLCVDDNGSGVEDTQRQKLFDAFFTTKPDGMGMGLAISKSIIEAHGGSLRLESGIAKGARFLIELPLAAAATLEEQYVA